MKKYILLCSFLLASLSTSAQKPAGHTDQFFIDMGYQSGIGENASDYYNVQLIYGRYRTPLLFYGIGATFRTNQLRDDKIAAVFINTKSRLIPKYEPAMM